MTPSPKFCRYCGNPLDENSSFCPECGKQIETGRTKPEKTSETPPAIPPPVVQPPIYVQPPQPPKGVNLAVIIPVSVGLTVLIVLMIVLIVKISSLGDRNSQKASVSNQPEPTLSAFKTLPPLSLNDFGPQLDPNMQATIQNESIDDFFNGVDLMTPTPGRVVYDTVEPIDWDELAKSFIKVKVTDCYYEDLIGYYEIEGNITNTSTTYSIAGIWLTAEIYSANGNKVTETGGPPDQMMLAPGTSSHFWLFTSYPEVGDPTCKVFAEDARMAP